jgi:7-carboxy-7-deazaguanine synthase
MPLMTRASTTQRLRPLDGKPPGQLLIHEIYRSIQGESTFAGLPCVFVRLAVCNSRCVWCDTPHAFVRGSRYTPDAIIDKVQQFGCSLVEITGGEPLLQDEVFPLMQRLADLGLTVLLETSGALDIGRVDKRVHIIMDLKCPDSGECEGNRWENLDQLKPTDQIKFVVASRHDFDWAVQVIGQYNLDRRWQVLLSPVHGAVVPLDLANWLLASGLQARLQLQLHKYIWDPHVTGV